MGVLFCHLRGIIKNKTSTLFGFETPQYFSCELLWVFLTMIKKSRGSCIWIKDRRVVSKRSWELDERGYRTRFVGSMLRSNTARKTTANVNMIEHCLQSRNLFDIPPVMLNNLPALFLNI